MEAVGNTTYREPWNKGKIVGQKAPFKPKDTRGSKLGRQRHHRLERPLAL